MKRSVAKLVGGSILTQLILFLTMPVIARLYGPYELGIYNTQYSIALLISTIAFFRYELTQSIVKNDKQASLSHKLCLRIGAFVFLICTFVLIGFYQFGLFVEGGSIISVLEISVIGILVAYLNFFHFYFVRVGDFKNINYSKLGVPIITVFVQLILGIFFNTSFILLSSCLLGNLIVALYSYRVSIGKSGFEYRFSRNEIIDFAKNHVAFPKYSVLSDGLLMVGSQSPIILLAYFYSPTIAAFFALSNRIAAIPIVLISEGVGRVFMNKVLMLESEAVANFTFGLFKLMTGFGILVVAIYIVVAKYLLPVVFGSAWGESADLLTPLYFISFSMFACIPMLTLLLILKKQRVEMYSQFLIMFSKISGLLVGIYLNDYVIGIAAYSLLGGASYFIAMHFLLKILSINPIKVYMEILTKYWLAIILASVMIVVPAMINVSNYLLTIAVLIYLIFVVHGLVGQYKEFRQFEKKFTLENNKCCV